MAWVAEVLNDLLGLPLTLSAVNVLEGRQCAPWRAMLFKVVQLLYQAVMQPDFENALNVASGEVREGLRGMLNFFGRLKLKRRCCAFLIPVCVCVLWNHFRSSVISTPRNLKLLTLYTAALLMWIGACSLFSLLYVVHDQLLCFFYVEGEVIFLALLRQGSKPRRCW